jgi:hypothetical protein
MKKLTLRMITHDWLIIAPPHAWLVYPFEIAKYKPSRTKLQVTEGKDASCETAETVQQAICR